MTRFVRPVLAAACLLLAAGGASAQTSSAPPAAPAGLPDLPPPLSAGNTAPTGAADPAGPTAPHATARELLQSGAYAARYGIQLSQLALQHPLSADLRDLAAQVRSDYTRSLTYLKPAADQAGLQLSAGLDAPHNALVSALAKLTGKAFEARYVAQIKTSSQRLANTLAAYRAQTPTQAPALRTWIGATLPIAQNHLGLVQEVAPGQTKP